VINAIVDALRPYGIRDIAMPATAFTIWSAIEAASSETKLRLKKR
jgi:carbon-monoxide dehydrogenase large subunit